MSRRIPILEDFSDPPIKLFGCNIQSPDSHSFPAAAGESESTELDAPASSPSAATVAMEMSHEIRKEAENGNAEEPGKEDVDSQDQSHKHEDRKYPVSESQERRVAELNPGSEGKGFKKPDKILPCPRCNSMETKFCYFNNYNVNQPRHFCRSCQRYWTAGGTIRNVPVGAGRRKNKHLSSQFPLLAIPPNGSSATHLNLLNSADSSAQSPTGLANPAGFSRENKEALQGRSDTPLCNSVATLLTLQDHKKLVESSNGSCTEGILLQSPSGSSQSAPTPRQNIESSQVLVQTGQVGSSRSHIALLPTLQGLKSPPPPAYPWNIGWNGMAYGTDNGQAILVPWSFSPIATYPRVPGVTPSGSFPFVPTSYVGCDASSWNLAASNQLSPSSSASNNSCLGNSSSPSLGKHLRDLNSQGEEPVEKCLWVPKTLRVDDPDEAAKSSVWTTLGIKPHKIEAFSKVGVSKETHVGKDEGGGNTSRATKEADQSLQANPAALSRSQAFQEST